MQLSLIRNPDILQQVAQLENRPFCVGFAAETHDVEKHAREKLIKKQLDLIAANHVAVAENPVFGSDINALEVFTPHTTDSISIPSGTKYEVATALLGIIASKINIT